MAETETQENPATAEAEVHDTPDPATVAAAQAILLDLLAVDAKAKDQGHSLVELLVAVGSSRYGIDVRPDPVKAD